MKTTTRTIFVAILSTLLGASVIACVPADDGSTTDTSSDTYASSLPTSEMLSLSSDDASGTVSQGLSTSEQALGDPSEIRKVAQDLREGLNELRAETHERISFIVDNGTSQEVTLNNLECKQWELDGPNNHWKLSACKLDRRAERFGWALSGKPLGAEDDAYLVVFAGKGVKLDAHEGRRRGAGQVGYNFDNVAALTGREVSGKLGIGYRAAGPARGMNIGMKDLVGPGMDTPHNALFQFRHVRGEGGMFRFATGADVATTDANGEIERGQDGTREFVRAGVAWNGEGRARTAAAVCGGTLGEGNCVYRHQCWEKDGSVGFDEETNQPVAPEWEASSCAPVPEDIDAPSEDGVEPAAADGKNGAPAVEEPPAF